MNEKDIINKISDDISKKKEIWVCKFHGEK